MFRYCLGLVTLCLVLVPDGLSAWGPSGCLPVGRPVAPVVTSAYRWTNGIDPVQVHLFLGDRQVGTYRRDDGCYYPYDGQDWGQPASCPTALPEGVQIKTKSKPCSCSLCGPTCQCERDGQCREALPGDVITQNFGVDTSRLSVDSNPRYYLGTSEVNRQSIVEALATPRMPDDASKVRLTVIGPPDACNRVLSDLKAIPGSSEVVTKCYGPTDWAVERAGFVTSGSPTIYLQAPDGRVLHRQDDYDGPGPLAEALRKAKPDYKPANDPDLRKVIPWPIKLPDIDPKMILLVALVGVGVYLYFRKAR